MGEKPIISAPQAMWDNHKLAASHYITTKRLGEGTDPPIAFQEPTKVRNDTGADRRAGEVVGLGDKILDTISRSYRWFSGAVPAACQPFGVLLFAAPDGAIMPVAVSGDCLAYVNVTATCHRFATVDGSHVLQSAEQGPIRILWRPDETGEQQCLVAFSWEQEDDCPECNSGSGSGSGCVSSFRTAPADIPGRVPGTRQVLSIDESDCLEWMDIEQCQQGSGSGSEGECVECESGPCGNATFDAEEGVWVPDDPGLTCPDGYVLVTDPPGATGEPGEIRPLYCCPVES